MSQSVLLFPGQAAQFVGMGSKMVADSSDARAMVEQANDILGYDLMSIMADGPIEKLTETAHTQPAVYLHSMLVYEKLKGTTKAVAVAGHSLGEITACVAAGVLSFEDGLRLVQKRAVAMQGACDQHPGTMAAIIGMEDDVVRDICQDIEGVVPANFNCPGQVVISGTKEGITSAVEIFKNKGARRAMEITVGGAFHSPLMAPAMADFEAAINAMELQEAEIPVYQNVDASPHTVATEIKSNLIKQVTSSVLWTDLQKRLVADGYSNFIEVGGKGKILMGMMRKVSREVQMDLWSEA